MYFPLLTRLGGGKRIVSVLAFRTPEFPDALGIGVCSSRWTEGGGAIATNSVCLVKQAIADLD